MAKAATTEKTNPAAITEAAKPAAKPAIAKRTMRVLDTTAIAGPPREHEQILDGQIKAFKFEAGKGLELPEAIAVKFLKHDGFKLVDEDDNVIEYQRAPKQPDELQAGEKLILAGDEIVARLDELTNAALLKRAMAMPGGERFANEPNRAAIIAFMIQTKAKIAKANISKDKDVGELDFVPSADFGEDAA